MKLFYQSHYGFMFEYRVNQLDYPPHIHDAVEIVMLQQGSSTVRCGTERLELTAGDIFVVFANQVHSYENSQDANNFLMILPAKQCLAAFGTVLSGQVPDSACIRKGAWEHTGLLEIVKMAYRDRSDASTAVMQGYMQVIFGKLLPLLSMHSDRRGSGDAAKALVEYIGDHYREPLTRQQIARAVGYNESYISHLFSEMLNTTVPEYINTLRIYDAQEMLLRTDWSVSRIAAELGFGSIRNFNRVFQKEMGMTPRCYRCTGTE